mmetsp:Transcript_67051/g.155615  ORF Transcript_67051/g.155615 Transcript_67051/m.155615 type:complete len:152 (+) Transcript_67051:68-523(+)
MELFAALLLATAMYRFGWDQVRRSRRAEKGACCGTGTTKRAKGGRAANRVVVVKPLADRPRLDSVTRKRHFQEAADRVEAVVRQGKEGHPTQEQLLRFYGLYKQATEGDVHGTQPWATQIKARAKYDSWASYRGLSKDEAMDRYVQAAESL